MPGTAYAQAAALRTLLAQSAYPGIAPRFRPVLGGAPIAQAVPFPDPVTVSAGQAERIAAIPGRVRQRLVELWRSARDRDGLGDEEIAELAVVYGLKVLERYELRRHPVRALRELLHGNDELLDGKLRRVEILTARARAGTVLDGHIAWEIAHSWGPAYAAGLHPDEPVLRGSATAALTQDPRCALPAVRLEEQEGDNSWSPRRDLLGSGPRDRHFVGELEDDGRLALRFGDGRHGARPVPGTRLAARYRLGGGSAGNVGAEAINHLVVNHQTVSEQTVNDKVVNDQDTSGECPSPPVAVVRNPLPAAGGTEPESMELVRQLAPSTCAAPDCAPSPPRTTRTSPPPSPASSAPPPRSAGPAAPRRPTSLSTRTAPERPARAARVGRPGPGGVPAHRPRPRRRPRPACTAGPRAHRVRRAGPPTRADPRRVVPRPGHRPVAGRTARVLPPGRPDLRRAGPAQSAGRRRRRRTRCGGRPSRQTAAAVRAGPRREEDGVLRLGPLEIATCDNDPDRPENGLLAISLTPLGGAR